MAGGGEDKEGFLLPFTPEVIFHLLISHPVGPGGAGKGDGGEQCTGPGVDQQAIKINYVITQLY